MAIDGTVITSVLAIVVSLGGAGVLAMRGKAVKAVGSIAKILIGISDLLVCITNAQADDNVSEAELVAIKEKALGIQKAILELKGELGL